MTYDKTFAEDEITASFPGHFPSHQLLRVESSEPLRLKMLLILFPM